MTDEENQENIPQNLVNTNFPKVWLFLVYG